MEVKDKKKKAINPEAIMLRAVSQLVELIGKGLANLGFSVICYRSDGSFGFFECTAVSNQYKIDVMNKIKSELVNADRNKKGKE